MTTIYREEQYTATRKMPVRTMCDGCGTELPRQDMYEKNTFKLERETGSAYPDCGSGDGWRVNHVCNACADRLKALLQANGFAVEDYEWDF